MPKPKFYLLLMLLLYLVPIFAADIEVKHVLYLNSYDINMTWTQDIYQGLYDVLSTDKNINIHTEFMDSKQFNSQSDFENFGRYIEEKYKNVKFKAIFSSDNNAFNFLREKSSQYFGDIPVVFCGVNDYKDEFLNGHDNFTGLAEVPSILATLELAIKLHPDTKKLYIINDYFLTGISWKNQFKSSIEELGLDLDVEYSLDIPLEGIKDKVSSLKKDTLVFLGVYYENSNLRMISYEDMAKEIGAVSNVPVYTLVNFNIQEGIIGGKVIDGYTQGYTIGEIGLRVLNGVDPGNISVGTKEYNRYIFNHKELRRFGIHQYDLPEGSLIVNQPFSVITEYQNEIALVIIIIIILILCILILIANISKRKQVENTLKELADSTWEGLAIHKDGEIIEINETFTKIFGFKLSDLENRDFLKIIFNESSYELIKRKIRDRDFSKYEAVSVRKNGKSFPVEVRVRQLDFKGEQARVIAVTDISDKKQSEHEYNYLLSLWDNMFENSLEGIFIFSNDQLIERVNKSFYEITGFSQDEVIGKPLTIFKSEYEKSALSLDVLNALETDGKWSGELLARRKSGELYTLLLTLSTFKKYSINDNLNIGIFHDISDQKLREEQLQWVTQNDTLTGFTNRSFFLEILNSELKLAGRNSEVCSIMLVNIDGLKGINNIYGLMVGDRLIKEFSSRLKACLREEDFVSRFAGDEFAILSPRFKSRHEVHSLIKRIRKSVIKPVIIDNHSIYLSISIGTSVYPFDGSNHQDLIAKSSSALKRTKAYRKGSYSFYNSELDKTEMINLELELDLQKAIKFNELFVYFQPKVDPITQKIKGFESLIRWNRYLKEWVSPDKFIPISEENGQIIEIGYFVIDKSCDFVQQLLGLGYKDFHVGINVSGKQFADDYFIDNLIEIVEKRGINPKYIDLEITESIAVSKLYNTIESLTRLSEYGFTISIDDFGTGYSSLQYLMSLPFDTIKIDKSFIDIILDKDGNKTVLNTMISLAHSLGKEIVAEGVETSEQVDYLINEECQIIQGYYYYRPMPLEDTLKAIKGNLE